MASSVFPEKRTRSQLTIPDDLLLHLSQGSPLKDARRHKNNRKESTLRVDGEVVDDSEDELLLSPPKPGNNATRMTKRSVSPPPQDEYALKPKSPREWRELKRPKLDFGEETALNGHPLIMTSHVPPYRPGHSRSYSQPASGIKSTRVRSGTVSTSSNADASSTTERDETSAKGKGRAQSVPLFVPPGIPRIDLRNPPPSPRKHKSRSPSKEPELRIVLAPTLVAKLATIPDEAMNIDEDSSSTVQPNVTSELSSVDIMTKEPILPPPTKEKSSPLLLPLIVEPPATPICEPTSPMSPLTPLPETPLPSKFVGEENRYTAPGWESIAEEEIPPLSLPPSPHKPLPALVSTMQSRLPRPSSSTNLAHSGDKNSKAPHSPAIASLAASASKIANSTPNVNNAFAVLMANAREKKDQAKIKGKGKAQAAVTKTISSGTNSKPVAGSSKTLQQSKAVDQGRLDGVSLPKKSLKSKMKPKAAQKAKPKPLPAVAPSLTPAAESEPNPPPPQPRSPSLHPTRPSSPVMADISMESIVPAVDANPVMEVTPDVAPSKSSDSVQVIGPSLASHDTVAESSDSMTVTAPAVQPEPDPSGNSSLDHYIGNDSEMPRDAGVNNVDKAVLEPIAPVTEAPTTITEAPLEQKPVDLPKKKLTTRKVHVSKRMPTSIPGPNRITRSASLKRNQMVVEVPKALPSNFSSKKSLVKSSSSASLEPEIVASSSSSKLAEDASPDTAMSTPTPDIPAEAVTADSISQGSPMRLDSPTKKTAKTPKSSFAQPTKSALAKQVSPTKPTMSKSRNSSPNKIGRSASMISRSRASLSRTFTSYSNLEGSSLSTLSSALEKLQQRPPERPNTSMGFNREDPDTSIELKSTSQDDTSVTQISALKATSSSSQGVGSSRLVQRTLFGGRSSLTGKSAIGSSGTMMRGTGGFKMPGKTGKLFGVGSSGVFTGAMRRTVQKASRKTSLPSVMASPVKGAHADDAMDIADDNDHPSGDSPADLPADSLLPLNDKGKGKEPVPQTWESAASRRVSLASQALSQSLIASSAKPPPGIGLMGPPATPKGRKARSTSSNYPSSSSSGGETTRPETPTRSSLRLAKSASESGSSGSKAAPAAPALIRPEPLKILKDCVIFVDVRNDDGEEVGSLFVEMLEGLGARILTRVGQTCTHIVFKNGLSSTINRYRLLRDPKPHVVGIAWVVDCVEQRSQVDETKFIVDLDGINFSGTTNKRRRSLLPKLISHHFEENTSSDVEGDISMDGSTSSMAGDDDLTPLERARLRKASAR